MTTLIPKVDLKNGGATPAGAVNRPINEKLQDITSVKDFGAIGDGAANDTDAIQAALNSISSGGSLYFPKGTYNHTGLSLTASNISLYGENATLVYSGSSNAFLIQSANNTNATNFLMDGMSFQNGLSAFKILGQGTGVYSNIKITNCNFKTSTSGMVWFEHCSDTIFDSNYLENGGDNGVYYSFSRNAVISNNVLRNCSGSGSITIGYSDATVIAQGISVVGNVIYADSFAPVPPITWTYGIDAVYCKICSIIGNTMYNTADAVAGRLMKKGIGLEELNISDVLISGNKITNVPEEGISLGVQANSVLSNITVANNQINVAKNAIYAYRTTNSQIANNVINFTYQNGIALDSTCTGINVVNNTIVDVNQQNSSAFYFGVYVGSTLSTVTGNTFIDSQVGGQLTTSATTPTYSIDTDGVLKLYSSGVLLFSTPTVGVTLTALRNAITGFAPFNWNLNIFPNEGNTVLVAGLRRTGTRNNTNVNQYSVPAMLTTAESSSYVYCDTTGILVTNNTYNTQVLNTPNIFGGAGQMFVYQADTQHDLNQYGGGRIFNYTAIPVTGNYLIGDIVNNSVPTVGQPKGWMCTASGASGTWVSMGNL